MWLSQDSVKNISVGTRSRITVLVKLRSIQKEQNCPFRPHPSIKQHLKIHAKPNFVKIKVSDFALPTETSSLQLYLYRRRI